GRTGMGRTIIQDACHISMRETRLHSGKRKRLRAVDPDNPGMGNIRTLDFAMKHPRQNDVTGKASLAGYLLEDIGARDARANDAEIMPGHDSTVSKAGAASVFFSAMRRAALRTASKILV